MKKFLIGVCALTLFMTGSVPVTNVVAAEVTQAKELESAKKDKKDCPELTDEQKAKMKELKAKMSEAKDKWEKLTNAQQDTIYALDEKAVADKKEIIKQYVSLGLIDEATANELIEQLTNRHATMKEKREMPMVWFHKAKQK